MSDVKHRVSIIGCGRLGQHYAEIYAALPNTEIVSIVEVNAARRAVVGERFGVKGEYGDVKEMLKEDVPDLGVVVTPTKYMKECVIACAEAGVKGISTDKPIAARLSDADEMVKACEDRGIVFAGGNLQRAMSEVQEAAGRLHAGEYGAVRGAVVHGFGGEISGGGCQYVSVLRLLTNAEVSEVVAWGGPDEAMERDDDDGLIIHGCFTMSNGMVCPVFGEQLTEVNHGVSVWTEDALIEWAWGPPNVYRGFDESGARVKIDPKYTPVEAVGSDYMYTSIQSFLSAVETGSKLWISGHDLRQALEVAIASKLSAQRGSVPVKLPLADRSHCLYPRAYRWLGGDEVGQEQPAEEARIYGFAMVQEMKRKRQQAQKK
ncbi:MAG: hypothetical protein CMJ49_11340 [Planctomycetaceae bacterium]|nr:hypothetical protein [Planctomycetaceae bacterium]